MTSYIEQTKSMLEGFTDTQLLEYDLMEDASKQYTMKFFSRLILSAQMIKPELQPIATIKMIQTSLSHGMSPFSPVGFVYFGQFLCKLGHVRDGYRYARIGRKLYDRIGTKEVAGEVIAQATQVILIVEPLQASTEELMRGQTIALAAGDTNGASLNSVYYTNTLFWSGTNINICKKQCDSTIRLLKERGQLSILSHFYTFRALLIGLLGMGEGTSTEQSAQDHLMLKTPYTSLFYNFQNMVLSFMLRDYEKMVGFAEGYLKYKAHAWVFTYFMTRHAFCKYGAFFCVFSLVILQSITHILLRWRSCIILDISPNK
jgi:hypothetical protein